MEISELKHYLQNLPYLLNDDGGDRRKKAQNDFYFFCKTYLPHHFGAEFAKDLSIFRNFMYKNLGKLVKEFRRLELEAYRGAAKTTIISRAGSLWLLLTHRQDY